MANILFQWLLVALLSAHQPYFISMTEIQHNKVAKTLEVSVRIFTDDLEKAIRKNYKAKVDLLNDAEKTNTDRLLKEYISSHVKLKVDGKDALLNYIGFEAQEGSIWSYFEIKDVASVRSLEVWNTILHDTQDKQVNFIHVKTGKHDETVKLDHPDNYKSFSLE